MSKKVHSRVATTGSTWCGLQIFPETRVAHQDAPEMVDCKNCVRSDPELGKPYGEDQATDAALAREEEADQLYARADRSARKMAALGMAYGTGASAFRLAMIDPLYNHLTNKKRPENRMKSWRRRL